MSDVNMNTDKKKLLKTVITRAPVAFVIMALLFFLPASAILIKDGVSISCSTSDPNSISPAEGQTLSYRPPIFISKWF